MRRHPTELFNVTKRARYFFFFFFAFWGDVIQQQKHGGEIKPGNALSEVVPLSVLKWKISHTVESRHTDFDK